jgi:hypothetical protein
MGSKQRSSDVLREASMEEQPANMRLARQQVATQKSGGIRRWRKFRAMGFRGFLRAAWAKLVFERVFPVFERLGLHVLPVHFYSPVPDTRQLHRNLERWNREWSFTGIDFDVEQQRCLVEQLAAFRREFDGLPSEAEIVSRGFGEGYSEIESRVLHAMLRMLKPKMLIEVGSGVSTFFSANALSINKDQDGVDAQIVCIEPYPYRTLKSLPKITNIPIEIIAKPVQDVELDVFKRLGTGDVLFIDSSHVSKLDSDVNRIYLEVLPCLHSGVFIHIHDIGFPYLATDPQHWVFKKHRFWNEASLLYAFLDYNSSFRIVLSLSYLHYKNRDTLQEFPGYDPMLPEPSSIWLRRVLGDQRESGQHDQP